MSRPQSYAPTASYTSEETMIMEATSMMSALTLTCYPSTTPLPNKQLQSSKKSSFTLSLIQICHLIFYSATLPIWTSFTGSFTTKL